MKEIIKKLIELRQAQKDYDKNKWHPKRAITTKAKAERLEKEIDEKKIFELAGGGFDSTVRLAKSSPEMWIPIFDQNRDNVLDVLDEHINTLASFRSLLIKKDFSTFYGLIQKANSIRKIIH